MLKHREHRHRDIVQINKACVPTPYFDCDWRCDELAMIIIGPSPDILYCTVCRFQRGCCPFLKCCDRVFLNPGWRRDQRISSLPSTLKAFARLIHHLPHPSPRTFSGLGCQGSRVAAASLRTKDGVITRVLNQGVLSSRQHQMFWKCDVRWFPSMSCDCDICKAQTVGLE